MTLAASDVIDLQFFLMDSARGGGDAASSTLADEVLASAAALDYALLLSSERPDDVLDDALPIAVALRATIARAAGAALDVVDRALAGPDDAFRVFAARQRGPTGIFTVLSALRAGGALCDPNVAFRLVTSSADVAARGKG